MRHNCLHLDGPTGESIVQECFSCGNNSVSVWYCSVHDTCTPFAKFPTQGDTTNCLYCNEYRSNGMYCVLNDLGNACENCGCSVMTKRPDKFKRICTASPKPEPEPEPVPEPEPEVKLEPEVKSEPEVDVESTESLPAQEDTELEDHTESLKRSGLRGFLSL